MEVINKTLKSNKIFIKNFKRDFEYQEEAILIKTILKEQHANIVLFIIDKGQGLMEHAASTDAVVYVIEGELEFTVADQCYNLTEGNILKLPADAPHSFIAVEKTKMILLLFN
jgi:quercetin dioxygenase-like cupin family protein